MERWDLAGWKEIGRYFGVHGDTARGWEKLGLPVDRVRGRVRAQSAEIYKWALRTGVVQESTHRAR